MLKAAFYALPHDTRRALYQRFKAKRFNEFQQLRHMTTEAGYSYQPYDERRCIFVHIPKAAGVSICKSTFGNLAGGHTMISRYQLIFSEQDFNNYFKFTFVRNPWSRLYSAYQFLKKGGMTPKDKRWADANLVDYTDFNTFVLNWLTPKNMQLYPHFLPQNRYLCLPGQSNLLVDFVGYFENIEDDFTQIIAALGENSDATLRHENKTEIGDKKRIDYTEMYSDEAAGIVAEVYRDDIELLGYNFDNSSLPSQLKQRPPMPLKTSE